MSDCIPTKPPQETRRVPESWKSVDPLAETNALLEQIRDLIQELIDEPITDIFQNCFDDPTQEFDTNIPGYTVVTLNDDGTKAIAHFGEDLQPIPAGLEPKNKCC